MRIGVWGRDVKDVEMWKETTSASYVCGGLGFMTGRGCVITMCDNLGLIGEVA